MDDLIVRLIRPGDSLEDLMRLLHRAYKVLADAGYNYTATDQDVETTRRRIEKLICYVALLGDRLVGTIGVDVSTDRKHTTRPGAAYVSQFAVDPEMQGAGIGRRLLERAQKRATQAGLTEIALDTAEGAADLISFYERQGYAPVGHVQWEGKTYRSVVMARKLSAD